MSFQTGTAYAESDADDEYERDIPDSSPTDVAESDISPTETDPMSAQHTPTTYDYHTGPERLPETVISEWTAEECADFIATIGLQQYADRFIENKIGGEVFIALQHDELKQMGITSVGHRLTILKSVYEVKKAQDVPVESDHYVPLTAETEAQSTTATLQDIKNIVEQLRLRDERMAVLEQDLRRLSEEFRRQREYALPALRFIKDAQQPLPHVNSDQTYTFDATLSPPVPSMATSQPMGVNRQRSTRKMASTTSPTHLQTTHERIVEHTLDPSNAAERAVLSGQHLSAVNGGQAITATSPSYPSPNIPSPTSPPSMSSGATLASRSYRGDQPTPSSRSTFAENDHSYAPSSREKPFAPRRMQTPAPDTPSSSVEIFKSFRVGSDDPCYKVLPAALRRYQINAPAEQYALYIVYGDQERCLAPDEKPLILFKQLEKEGKKPMFMLRKTANAQVDLPTDIPGSAGLNAAARGASTGYDPPGGII